MRTIVTVISLFAGVYFLYQALPEETSRLHICFAVLQAGVLLVNLVCIIEEAITKTAHERKTQLTGDISVAVDRLTRCIDRLQWDPELRKAMSDFQTGPDEDDEDDYGVGPV